MNKYFDKEYRPRIIDKLIKKYLKVAGAICIEGPKWSGKTWTSIHNSKSFFFVDDPKNNFSNRKLAENNLEFVLKGENPRMIDEWQEVQSIWDATRFEIDKRNKKGLFILTGSSAPSNKGVMHSGSGRIITLRMNTMSLYESNDSSGSISLKELCNGNLTTQNVDEISIEKLAYLIIRGGWPGNLDTNENDCNLMPKSYVDTILNNTLHSYQQLNFNTQKMKLILKSLARNESTCASEVSILNDVKENDNESISRTTLRNYLDLINQNFLTNNQEPYSPNFRSSLRVKQFEKRRFSDPAMAAALLELTPKKLLSDFNLFGLLFESLVIRDLKIYAQAMNAKVFHYQDYANNELDAIIELEDGNWCAFEIKLGSSRIEEAANNLNKVTNKMVQSGANMPKIKCIICGIGNVAYQREDGIFVIPINALKD